MGSSGFMGLFIWEFITFKVMSPASKSKSKRASKEHQKTSSKPSGSANASTGIPANAYNPLSGTFHALETVPTSSSSPRNGNGRYRNIDEPDDHLGSSLGIGIEYDSVSNNGSWSGESEDHKEKNIPVRQETIPGADNDKREKTRQKNERKHQRQKERRAQELHERCSGYLMSRKLEALAQQLVAMGFSREQATMALILNEGKVEESVSWLFEGGEDADKLQDHQLCGSNLKIDISEELARMADMEIKYKCNKQEVERAVVAAEGDLEKAAESLRELKLDPPAAPLKPEETGDPPTASNGKVSGAVSQNVMREQQQQKPNPPSMIQQRRDDRDFNYTKTAVPVAGSSEPGNKILQPLKRIQAKVEWAKPQQTAVSGEKRWPSAGSSPSVSYSLASPLQVSTPPSKREARFVAVGSEYKNHHPATVKEPVIMMQRPQSVNTKQVPATSISSSPGTTASWYPTNSVDIMKSNGLLPHIPTTRSLSPNDLNSNQMFHQLHFQQQQHFIPGSSPGESLGISRGNGLWSKTGASPTIAAASSLGLFSGLGGSAGSSGASSPVDWSTAGSMAQLDYSSIDWSLDRGLSSPRSGGMWIGPGPLRNGTQIYDSSNKLAMRTAASGNGVRIPGLQDVGVAIAETSSANSHEWTSPFEGKDLFTLPRQFVSSPSL
ncbi:uncharacterized protein LOC110627659 isoform X2 [Manihot esculenta]|uniref:Uncharacterized protein n=2 Tax=Manihot esculenta TaxID=3983 RepID=A0ACB7IDE5_MANES|nr:uncharacterized protein LOC110627659 isoform X2 [Manihot esculenta]KAG8663094.1 hypothetical protein MANES_01G176500v8 [Manihot esculenta]OAY61268.1 hypothetical protein MANES_01G176500v8 [Manihot esculenta]